MRALVYKGPSEIQLETVEGARSEHSNDVVLRLPTSCICGSDLRVHRTEEGVADHRSEDLRATYLTSTPAGVSA